MKNTVNTSINHLQSLKSSTDEMRMLINFVEEKGSYNPKKLLPFLESIVEEIDKRKVMRGV